MDTKRLVRAYLKIRDAKDALKREYDEKERELKATMNKIEVQLLKFLNEHGIENSGTDEAIFYKQEEIKPSCQDWKAFHDWIAENDAFDMLQKRITVKSLKDFMEEHDGELPPGVSVHREYAVHVRRK